jgi:glutaminyl-peptide cyclotransferase
VSLHKSSLNQVPLAQKSHSSSAFGGIAALKHFNCTVLVCVLISVIVVMSSSICVETACGCSRDAWWYLEQQISFGPRNPGSVGHVQVREFLHAELLNYADLVEVQEFEVMYEGKEYEMANISAFFKSASGESEPYIILAAHFDTRPQAEQDTDPSVRNTPIIGANDGASGVAVLMEVAGVLSTRPPPAPIRLVFFDGEDFGPSADTMFLGSRRLAETLDPSEVRYMILLDMVGDAELDIFIEGYSYMSAPQLVNAVWASAASMGYESVFHDEARYWILDDHIPFINRGIPAIDIIDFDYPYWHTTGDTIDKCSKESLNVVRDVVLDVVFSSPIPLP